ncbi:MAG: nucleoside transporter C-terminal domain-containing protein [Gemmatimonadota bacterium]
MGLVGVAAMVGLAVALSYDRRRINWRLVATGIALQVVVGILVLKTGVGRALFDQLGQGFTQIIGFAREGARLVFGDLVDHPAFLAFSVLPAVIFFSSLMSVLYHLGVMQVIVKGIAWVMQKPLRTSGAETLSAAGNIFLGQIEAPLLVKPFVRDFTPSELFTVMVGGFATSGGGIMAAYIAMLSGLFPNIAAHLITASVMNAPAGLYLSKIMLPETGTPRTRAAPGIRLEKSESSVIEAAASGALQGVQLAINIAAVLIAFVALVALLNALLGWVGGLWGQPSLSLQWVLGELLRPVAWVLGVPWQDTPYVGGLIGLKATINDFVAYAQFAKDLGSGVVLAPRSAVILTYALLGFANFGSIAIQIGGIGGLAPERRSEIARYGLRAMIAGNLAAFTSAALAGMLL